MTTFIPTAIQIVLSLLGFAALISLFFNAAGSIVESELKPKKMSKTETFIRQQHEDDTIDYVSSDKSGLSSSEYIHYVKLTNGDMLRYQIAIINGEYVYTVNNHEPCTFTTRTDRDRL